MLDCTSHFSASLQSRDGHELAYKVKSGMNLSSFMVCKVMFIEGLQRRTLVLFIAVCELISFHTDCLHSNSLQNSNAIEEGQNSTAFETPIGAF